MNDPLGLDRTRSPRKLTFWMVLVAVATLLAACGDDGSDDSGGGTADEDTTSTGSDNGATGQPAVHEETVTIVEGLLARYDEHSRVLFGDPEAPDGDDRRTELEDEIFTADSPTLVDLLEGIDAAEGDLRVEQSTRLYLPGATDEDTLTFGYCRTSELSPRDDDDQTSVPASSEIEFGNGEAHRVDGSWHLHELEWGWVEPLPPDDPTAGCSDEVVDDAIAVQSGEDR